MDYNNWFWKNRILANLAAGVFMLSIVGIIYGIVWLYHWFLGK